MKREDTNTFAASLHLRDLLIETTLAYRDQLHAEGIQLTVAETREALDTLQQVLQTDTIPPDLDRHVRELVIRWLKAVQGESTH